MSGVEQAVVGTAFGEVTKPITGLVSKAWKFKATRRKFASTLECLGPVVEEMKQLDRRLDRPNEETERLMEELREGRNLVSKYTNVPWWKFCWLPFYYDKLQARDERLVRTLMVTHLRMGVVQTAQLANSSRGIGTKGLFKAPGIPKLTVGLDIPFKKLKPQLLQSGASVFVLTGLAGSGKTTLATLLCSAEDVRGKFGENILFVPVSKTPDLKIIVQTLFQRFGLSEPYLLGNDHTVIALRVLLEEVGKSPMMLVLDDVWPGSESLIEAFNVPLPDYKVLVTSRVKFPRFKTLCRLKPLRGEDAVDLFRRFALLNDGGSYIPHENSVRKVAAGCRGSPLALEVIGSSLRGQPIVVWQKIEEELSKGGSIFDSDADLRKRLQKYLDDVLEDKPVIMDCFMDLGLFPEDHKIPVAALIDMWTELYEQVNDEIGAVINLHDLNNRHLVKLVNKRKVAMEADMFYNNHFLMQHDLLRELAIHQSNQEPFAKRKRLIIDLSGNNRPEWWVGQNQQGIISRILSFIPIRWIEQKEKKVAARTLSISTDETFASDWYNLQPEEAEVLVLNLRSSKYTLPEFTRKMSKLKVLIVTNYGFHLSDLNNFELLGSLSGLKRIRLEKVSVPSLVKLNNLRKLSLYMCNTSQAFESGAIPISAALPMLVELSIDYCKDLVELPAGLCDITSLKNLSINTCIRFSALPQEIGNLENLEKLRLSSCFELGEIPASIGKLRQLRVLDISGCVSLGNLPEEIGDLGNLKRLIMTGCSGCTLPRSVTKLEHLRSLICDEETATFWKRDFKPYLPNLEIKEVTDLELFIRNDI